LYLWCCPVPSGAVKLVGKMSAILQLRFAILARIVLMIVVRWGLDAAVWVCCASGVAGSGDCVVEAGVGENGVSSAVTVGGLAVDDVVAQVGTPGVA